MRTAPLALIALTLLGALSCRDDAAQRPAARAERIADPSQIVGGPAARAETGDYLLQNEHVRVVIQDLGYNRGSGLFGGSLIDADLIRNGLEADPFGGNGLDSFGEMFPAFFLEVVEPEQIEIVSDGSNGGPAAVEVSGRGGEFVSLARVLNQVVVNSYDPAVQINRVLFDRLPPLLDQPPQVRFRVRYELAPGARHVKIKATIENASLSTLEFPNAEIAPLLSQLAGIDLAGLGVPTGHVVGFGALNRPFIPGIGFDLQFGVQRALARGLRLPALPGVVTPLVGSVGQGVSYGFAIEAGSAESTDRFVYSKDQLNGPDGAPLYGGSATPEDMLFLFYASGFGGVFTHQMPDRLAPSVCRGYRTPEAACDAYEARCEEGGCDPVRGRADCLSAYEVCAEAEAQEEPSSFTSTSLLLIGDGDVSSLWDELYEERATPTGEVRGRVIDAETGLPTGAGVSVLIYKPGPMGCAGEGEQGPILWSQALTREEGFFSMRLAEGEWCQRARSDGRALGEARPFVVRAGRGTKIEPVAGARARLQVEIVDEAGRAMPGRVTLVGTHEEVNPPGRLPNAFLFDLGAGERWTTTDLVPDQADDPATRRYIEQIAYVGASGRTELFARPGIYEVYVSRGPEFELYRERAELKPGQTRAIAATLERGVSTPGYLSADFHLHARGSIDSGLDYTRRVVSLAGEGIEIAASSDHNYVSDYAPFVQAAGLEPFMHSVVGLELTTFEAGHFNAFPLVYEPGSSNRGSFRWQAQPPGLLFEELRRRGSLSPGETVVQVNHPRDMILGYFTQHNMDPLTADVALPYNEPGAGPFDLLIAPNGRAFYEIDEASGRPRTTFSWNFDAIEVMNGRRYELLRHLRASADELRPGYTGFYLAEVLDEQGGYDADACEQARAAEAEGAACETTEACAARARTIAACDEAEERARPEAKRRAEEALSPLGDDEAIVCDGGEVAFPGALDDWYNLLNTERPWGLHPYESTVIEDRARRERAEGARYRKYTATGNSDSHSAEFDDPGYPRNYVFVGTDDPANVTDAQIARAVLDHRVVVSNGPLVTMRVNGAEIGDEIEARPGPARIELEVRAPRWIDVTRWRLIANGEPAAFGEVALVDGIWSTELEIEVDRDTWFVAEVEGDQSMFPILAPSEIPQFDFAAALGGLTASFGFGAAPGALRPETVFPIRPLAFTNPIWVEVGGDGRFDPPGVLARGCDEVIYSPTGLIASPTFLDSDRLRSIRPPFRAVGERHKPTARERSRRDVRLLFEAWGHAH